MHAAPPDTLYLWFLGNPGAPALVGELNLVMNRRGVSLKYADAWLRKGFPLSEDLPLIDVEHLPREKDTAAGAELSYPSLALLLRRRGPVDIHREQMRELFRRLVFNILIDNTDDHEKNHVILVREDQQYVLAPAFDVLPIGQSLGYQAMEVGRWGAEATLENALSAADQYWLTSRDALTEARQVAQVVQGWQYHFAAQGVPEAVCEELARHIDRPFLKDQRLAL